MALTKSELFTEAQQQTAELFKAMGHPARLAILELLSKKQSCICGDITNELPLAQSTVSQHLKALKSAGIIQGDIDGVRTCYCLSEKGVRMMHQMVTPIIEKLHSSVNQKCC
tara:strand:- start:17416 stop:17751 length:336 start_codon:yes stop_codon:yes gene_type:complete